MSCDLPLLPAVDLLIIGGSATAVACACAAAEQGRSVLLAAPKGYCGDDIVGPLDLWPQDGDDFSDPLAGAIWPGTAPASPLQVKRACDAALLAAGVDFLFHCHPAGLLRDADGRVAGAVLANRRGRQAVPATQVIDASRDALLAEQAGHACEPQLSGVQERALVSLGGGRPTGAKELPPLADDKGQPVPAWRTTCRLDYGDGGWVARAAAYDQALEQVWQIDGWLAAEELQRPARRLTGPARIEQWQGVAAVDEAAWQIETGLWLCSESLPVALPVAEALARPGTRIALGRHLGSFIGRQQPAAQPPVSYHCAGAEPVNDGELRQHVGGLRPEEPAAATLAAPASTPRLGAYQVAVIGGGTGGAPAAIAAAEAGASTLCCEQHASLGGVGTEGQIAKYWFGNRVGFTKRVDDGVAELEPKVFHGDGRWSLHAKATWWRRSARAAGVDILYGSCCCGAWVVDGQVRGVLLAGPMGFGLIDSGAVIDATGAADVAAAAGAPVTGIAAEHVAVQGTGLADRRPDRPYNNSDHDFCDDTDVVDCTRFLVGTRAKVPGALDCGQLIDSRERRQIVGEISLQPADFVCDRRFPDTITIASSNFDTHGFTIHPLFLVKPMDERRLWVHVPYRALLPQGLEGLLATGLSLSAHRDALPVVRMQADVQNHGYAAGRAAATAVQQQCRLRDVDIVELQRHLVAIGTLPPSVLCDVDSFPVSDERLRRAVDDALDTHAGIALCFTETERARPLLRQRLEHLQADHPATDPALLIPAQILALLGDTAGAAPLAQALQELSWDAGWNYTGMGQFGMSTSAIDGYLIALATVGDASAWPVIADKLQQLAEPADFSHCRALAIAYERLQARHPRPETAAELASLLDRPGMTGHHWPDLPTQLAAQNDDLRATESRNLALRELALARACYRCGDSQGQAEAILANYRDDLRGAFARHAKAILTIGRQPTASVM